MRDEGKKGNRGPIPESISDIQVQFGLFCYGNDSLLPPHHFKMFCRPNRLKCVKSR